MPSELLLILSSTNEPAGKAIIDRAGGLNWTAITVGTIAEACDILTERTFDAVLLDLFLPDEQGIECFVRTFAEVPNTPIAILTAPADEELARQAVSAGASALIRSDEPIELILDVLGTLIGAPAGLPNRGRNPLTRGEFVSAAERFIHLARLSGKSLLLCTVRTRDNATGEREGAAGEILLRSLRASDLLSALGDGRFAALAIVNPGDDSPHLLEMRLDESNATWNALKPSATVQLAASFQRFDPEEMVNADELLLFAEAALTKSRLS